MEKVRSRILLLVATALAVRADVRDCTCEVASPTAAATPGCSLCLEAAKHPPEQTILLVHDKDPLKANRWLAVPRAPYDGANFLKQMPASERLALWTSAIAKGKELWGDDWAIAMN